MANDDLLPDLVNADISNINPRDAITAALIDRSSLAPQMTPEMRARLQTIVQGEVGHGAPPEQQQVQLESTLNRALTRAQPLEQVTRQYTGPGSSGYYPASTFVGGRIRGPDEYDRFQRTVVDPVLAGSDVGTQRLGFAPTGNASGGVAARGIASGRYNRAGLLGGETYVQQETPAQLARLEALRGQGGGGRFNVPSGAPTLTANDLSQDPSFAPGAPLVQVAQADTGTVSDAGNPPIPSEIPKAPEQPPQGYAPKPSQAPLPQFEYVESEPLGPEPPQPKPLPPSAAMEYAAHYMNNPDVSEGTRAYFKRLYEVDDSYRKELEARATAKWNIDIAQWNKDKGEIEKRRLSKPTDVADLTNKLLEAEDRQQKLGQAYKTNPLEVEKLTLQNAETKAKTAETLQNMAGYNTQVINGVLYVAPKNDPNNWQIAKGVPNFHLAGEQDKEFNLFAQGEVASRQLAKHDINSMASYTGAAAQQLAQVDPKGVTGLWRLGANGQLSPEAQQSFNAAMAWSEANLRTKSGAVMNRDEIAQNFHLFFPIPGDDANTIMEKAQRRRAIEESNYLRLGTATPLGDRYRETLDQLGLPTPLFSEDDPRYAALKPGQLYILNRKAYRKK